MITRTKNIFIAVVLLSTYMMFYVNRKNFYNSDHGDGDGGGGELKIMDYQNSKFRWCSNELLPPIELNCRKLFSGDTKALRKAANWLSPCIFSDAEAMRITTKCQTLRDEYPFWNEFYKAPNDDDEDYPLAYVFLGAKGGEQTIRLLQAVYHPRNIYCMTYDNKSSDEFKQTLRNLDNCYENIIMPDKFVKVYWGGFSILQSVQFCLDALRKQKAVKWHYVQVLSWNDYPLRTNGEFVKIMKIFNGAQDSLLEPSWSNRTRHYFDVKFDSEYKEHHIDRTKNNALKNIPPGGLVEYKGSLATTMSREFVEFVFTNPVAKKFYEWVNSSFCPEEFYWSTILHNLHLNPPGGFPGACLSNYAELPNTPAYMSRYQLWYGDERCKGVVTKYSCVYGVRDLLHLKTRPEFMAHKLYMDYQPAAYYCLAQLHFNRTFFPEKYAPLDERFYANLPAVRYHRMKDKDLFNCY
jgi:hypothetical protein